MIREFSNLAARNGHDGVIALVRPSIKHLPVHSDARIASAGRTERPLRSMAAKSLGRRRKLVKPADRSMVVEERVAFLGNWRGSPFPNPATSEIDGALNPVSIDLWARHRRYVEPTSGSPIKLLA